MALPRTLSTLIFALTLLVVFAAGGAQAAVRPAHSHGHASHHTHATKGHPLRHHHGHSAASTVASVTPQS